MLLPDFLILSANILASRSVKFAQMPSSNIIRGPPCIAQIISKYRKVSIGGLVFVVTSILRDRPRLGTVCQVVLLVAQKPQTWVWF